MRHSIIEPVGIQVSRLGFGTASLHHLYRSNRRQELLRAAFDAGISHYDTSPYYGYGLAEWDLGRFMRGHRSDFTVTTKVGLYPWGPTSSQAASVWSRTVLGKLLPTISLPVVNWKINRASASLRESLKRMNTDYVDFLFLHEPDYEVLDTDEMLNWLESERKRGTIRAWGLAGLAERVTPWVQARHPLANVIQTQDNLDLRQADFLLDAGRSLQFTYGYFSSQRTSGQVTFVDTMRRALERNPTGTILVSTRRTERLIELKKAFT